MAVKTRETIRSTDRQRRAFERAVETGVACRDALEYAMRNDYAKETIEKIQKSIIEDRVKLSRVRLELQANPRAYRQRLPGTFSTDPTPERIARAGKQIAKTRMENGAIQYRSRSLLEQYREKLQITLSVAIERYQIDGKYAQRCRVADPEASRGFRGGDVIGGIGDIPNFARVGFARFRWVNKYLGEEGRSVARALITQEDTRNDGTPFSFEDFGKRLDPSIKHVHRRWGVAFGALKVLAGQLVRLYELCPIEFSLVDQFERGFVEAAEEYNERRNPQ